MREPWPKIARVALPITTLALFYSLLAWFSVKRARVYPQPRPVLTAEQSKALLSRSRTLLADGRYAEALRTTSVLLEAYPENHIYIDQVARIYEHLGDYEQAARYWEKYLDVAPSPEAACPQVGDDYWKEGASKEQTAVAAYERCLKLNPANPDSIFYLAHALEKSGELDRAADLYQRGIKISPTYADLRLGLARVWVRQGKYAEAERAAHEVLTASPNYVDALFVEGMSHMKRGDLKEAKKYFTRGAALSDTYADFHLALGRIAEDQKDYREAIRQYTRVVQLQPTDEATRSRLETLERENRP